MNEQPRTAGLAWHVHHDRLVEYCYNIEERREYIRQHKPVGEQAIRLTRLQLVRAELGDRCLLAAHTQAGDAYNQAGDAYNQAGAAYNQAWAAYTQAWAAYTQAWAAYTQAGDAYNQAGDAATQARDAYAQAWDAYLESIPPDQINAAHREECLDCPWDGITLFPEGGRP